MVTDHQKNEFNELDHAYTFRVKAANCLDSQEVPEYRSIGSVPYKINMNKFIPISLVYMQYLHR